MREINLGPVFNPDGSPSDVTIAMLAGTGRTMVASESALSSIARRGGNSIRTNAMDRVLDGAYKDMSTRELFAFCDAMQVFAPIVIRS